MTRPEGLRERRRRETARDIHLVALRLVRERGFDAVTVDVISAAAGIAPRTFFNYFPTKEAAVVQGPPELSDDDAADFCQGGAVPYPQLLTELVGLLSGRFAGELPSRDEMYDVFTVSREHPAVFAAMLAQLEAFQSRAAQLVARRLGLTPDDEVATLVAALAMAILRSGFDRWVAHSPGDGGGGPGEHVEHVAALVQNLFGPGLPTSG